MHCNIACIARSHTVFSTTYFSLNPFSVRGELFLLKLKKNIHLEADSWYGKFQPEHLRFGKVKSNRKPALIMESVGQL